MSRLQPSNYISVIAAHICLKSDCLANAYGNSPLFTFRQFSRGTAAMLLRRFRNDRRANVAPIFALAIVPVIGLVGMAVDYSRGNSMKAAVQAALDATALAMARTAPNLTAAQLQQQSSDMFFAQFNRSDAKNVVVTASYDTA